MEVLEHPLESWLIGEYLHGEGSQGWDDSGAMPYFDVWWNAMHTAISGSQPKPSTRMQP